MSKNPHQVGSAERGQVLVIVAISLVALIAMVGLVIDGGNAWGQQRETQNGADSAAKAGTVAVQNYLSGGTATDGDVGCAVEVSALENAVDVDEALYTDYEGDLLVPDAPVGSCAAGGGASIPAGAQGVKATTTQDFDTYLMGIVGIGELSARADAIAVVGVVPSVCPASAGCGVLPVTFPHRAVSCDGSNKQVVVGEGDWAIHDLDDPTTVLNPANLATIPLCTTGPGSVGWLDFGCAPNLAMMVDDPCNIEIPIPAWLRTETGNVNSLEGNLEAFTGALVGIAEEDDIVMQFPIHDNTCSGQPANDDDTCQPIDAEGSGGGSGMYYHIPYWQGFKMDAAYTGGNDAECGLAPGLPLAEGNGATGCFKGWFVSRTFGPAFISTGQVDPGDPVPTAVILVN
ncbi:MAG: pilus assembly protein TadG-related protein [Chloroflexi bacterium]|nr:pilus assembly protein TadG-related protein [Chloroflexota bacterium]